MKPHQGGAPSIIARRRARFPNNKSFTPALDFLGYVNGSQNAAIIWTSSSKVSPKKIGIPKSNAEHNTSKLIMHRQQD